MAAKKKPTPKLGRPKIDDPATCRVAMRITPATRDLIQRVQVKIATRENRIVSPKDVVVEGINLLAAKLGA